MAFLYITEHPELKTFPQGNATPAVDMPPIATQRIANDGVSTQSAAFQTGTHLVGIHSDSICSVEFGANPTATTSSRRLAANSTEYFRVQPGHKVAAILNT